MDLAHLSYFSALCETLNYTEAAHKCFISRQAMRQSLQALEQAYGVCLIENRHNHLSLTPAGRLLYEKTQPVLNAYKELTLAMKSCVTAEQSLRVGVSRSLTPFYAPEMMEAIENFIRDNPQISVSLSLLPSDEILESCRAGKLDAGILVSMGKLPLPWNHTILRKDCLTLLLGIHHPLAKKGGLSLDDLNGQTLLVMGEPELFFQPLYQDIRKRNLSVKWITVPDFYEVGYRILQNDHLAVDRQNRQEWERHFPTDPDLNLPLENDSYALFCCLLTPEPENDAVRLLRHALQTGKQPLRGEPVSGPHSKSPSNDHAGIDGEAVEKEPHDNRDHDGCANGGQLLGAH